MTHPPAGLRRRRFSGSLLGAALSVGLATARAQAPGQAPAPAQPNLVEGVHYLRLLDAVPTVGAGTIEVIEFFWYECPHCNAFEPALDAWSQRLPVDVALRRVPVWFREEPFGPQQRLFYALEGLGALPALHRRVFQAIHQERVRLRTPDEMATFVAANGVEPAKFLAAYQSFAVQARAQQARQTAAAYRIDAVPAMGVHGRYTTTGALATSGQAAHGSANVNDRMLGVVDTIVARVRQGARS